MIQNCPPLAWAIRSLKANNSKLRVKIQELRRYLANDTGKAERYIV